VNSQKRPLRLAFMGSPDFSVPALQALHDAGHDIAAVYCQPPKPAGRGQKETPCPVHRAALELGLPVRHPGGRKRALGRRRPTETPPAANQRRSLYFVSAPDPTVPSLTNPRDGSI
jgi:hypothetical protein